MSNNNNNPFVKSARIGNLAAIKVLDKMVANNTFHSYKLSEDQFSPYDAVVVSNTIKEDGTRRRYFIEFKNRNMKSTKFTDYIMEMEKYNKLIEMKKENEFDGILYLNTFTQDSIAFIWIVDRIMNKVKKVSMTCPKYSAIDKGEVYKYVAMLPTDKAIKVDVNEGVTDNEPKPNQAEDNKDNNDNN
jgi:hypothetical protein